jgi:hypothetical protein
MRYSIALGVFTLIFAATAALATERAYLLVENAPTADVTNSLDKGLQNCLALLANIYPNETIVHLECSEPADVNVAIAQMAKVTGVTRVILLALSK